MQHLAASKGRPQLRLSITGPFLEAECALGRDRQQATPANASNVCLRGNFTAAESATRELRLNGPPKLHLE
jgi:hypothetical protein